MPFSSSVRSLLSGCAGHAFTFLIHWSMETATMTSTPMASTRHWSSTPARLRPMLNTSTIKRTEDGADDAAAATEQAGAADHHGGDALQVGVDDGVGTGRAGPADQHPRGDAVDQPGDRVDAEQHPVDPDTDQPSRFDVVADGVDVPTPAVWPRTNATITAMIDHDDHTRGDPERPDEDRVARPDEGSAASGADRLLAARVEQRDRGEDAQRAQGDDERWQVEPGDQQRR